MIYESYPWKQDLIRRKRLLLKYNTAERLEKNYDSTCTVVEKSIFYSAFIIRKLLDCGTKLSSEADNYSFQVKSIKPLKRIDYMHRWPEESSHDWKNEKQLNAAGRDICNWLIHSYLFFLESEENGSITDFCVSSDYDKNKMLYKISLNDWLKYVEFVSSDDIVSLSFRYDKKVDDYLIERKERWGAKNKSSLGR